MCVQVECIINSNSAKYEMCLQVRVGEFDGKPRLTIKNLSEIEEHQFEVECQLTTYNLKTVTFKVRRCCRVMS